MCRQMSFLIEIAKIKWEKSLFIVENRDVEISCFLFLDVYLYVFKLYILIVSKKKKRSKILFSFDITLLKSNTLTDRV